MSKLIVNEIEKYDAGQLTITTGTDVSIGSDLTVGGSIAGTLSTAAQTNITSVGTLSSLAVNDSFQINGSSNVSTIKTDSDNSNIVLVASSALVDNKPRIQIQGTTFASDPNAIQYLAGEHIFKSSAAAIEYARINTSGNLVFPNGQGIDFSASAGGGATSSLLDDYEEGTWTPAYEFSTSGTATMSSQNGYYTKIGNQVTVWFQVNTASISSPTGDLTITGLPFTSNVNNRAGASIGFMRRWATDMPNIKAQIDGGSTAIDIFKQATDSFTTIRVQGSDLAGTISHNNLEGSVTYFV